MGQNNCDQCPADTQLLQQQIIKPLVTKNTTGSYSTPLIQLATLVGKVPTLLLQLVPTAHQPFTLHIGPQGLLSGQSRGAKDGQVIFGNGPGHDVILAQENRGAKFRIQYKVNKAAYLLTDLGKGPGTFLCKKVAVIYDGMLFRVGNKTFLCRQEENRLMLSDVSSPSHWIELKAGMVGFEEVQRLVIKQLSRSINCKNAWMRFEERWRWMIIGQSQDIWVYINEPICLQEGMVFRYGEIQIKVLDIA